MVRLDTMLEEKVTTLLKLHQVAQNEHVWLELQTQSLDVFIWQEAKR